MKCLVCQSQEIKVFLRTAVRTLWSCEKCGLIFVWPQPKALAIKKLYRELYYHTSGVDGGVHGYTNYEEKRDILGHYFGRQFRMISLACGPKVAKRMSILDIGCGLGFFLEIAQRAGWEVTGLDLSEYAIKKIQEKGMKGVMGTIFDARFSANSFDVVTCFQTVEHISSPVAFLAEIKRILKPGGLLLVTTPNRDSVFAKTLGRGWHGWRIEGHLVWFTKRNLGLAFNRAEFLKVKVGSDILLWESLIGMADGLRVFYPSFLTRGSYRLVNLLPSFIKEPLLVPELPLRSVTAMAWK